MSHASEEQFPKGALIAGALLMAVSIAFAAVAKLTDVGATRLTIAEPLESLDLVFKDLTNGSIGVVSTREARQIAELAPGESGFVRVVLRGLARGRLVNGGGMDEPFRLTRHTDGQTTLTDLATGRVVTLSAFSRGNAAAFEQFFAMGRTQQ